ncbi:tetratricopeptide repeat protein [Streptomyces sp. NA04227]|nr:tetratricopeptide repeat protein [Streptomyces sp. NA04227]
MDGRAHESGRIYQTTGDQHITEYHHHGDTPPGPGGPDSVRRPAVGRGPVVLRDRTEVLERLREGVAESEGRLYVLHGMGGSGKTAVAHAFFQSVVRDDERIGLWVNAADRASLRAGMLAVAADRGAGDGELLAARNGLRPAADLVWGYLERSAEPWLLVLDNADDPEILRDGGWLRTSPRGTVLVTSRRAAPRWWPGAQLQHIGVLPREDAARVLCDLAPHSGSMAEAGEIADRLGRLPLALVLAGGFLSHQVLDPWTMELYGRHLDTEHGVRLLDRGAETLAPQEPRQLVGRTWQLTLDAFAAHGLPEAASLLRLLSRFAPEPLPLPLLNSERISAALPRERCETALRALLDQSLTELVDLGVRCAQTHGILLDSVAAAIGPEDLRVLNETAVLLLDAAIPQVPDLGPEEPMLRLIAPHALALIRRTTDPETAADALRVATRLSVALHRQGDYLSGWETVRTAAAYAEPLLGDEHRAVLAAHSRVGRSLFRLGRYEEAEQQLSRVHTTQQELFGSGDEDALDTAHGLQLVLANLGRREESLILLRSVVAGRRALFGPRHALTLRSRSSLLTRLTADELAIEQSAVEQGAGEQATSDDSGLFSLPADCAQALGPEHTVTLGARHNHAWALFLLGRHEEADTAIREVHGSYVRRFGPDFPLTLAAQQLHARTRYALGRPDAATALLADVVARRAQGLGPAHPFTEASRELLARFEAGE